MLAVRRYNAGMDITLSELEQAINYWRSMRPASGEERALSPEVDALAKWYALMIFHHTGALPVAALDAAALQLIEAWRNRTP
jgi:hypothetical protein